MAGQLDFPLGHAPTGALRVSQLVRAIRETLELTMADCWVVGEVSNARLAPSNHFYFTLKDAGGAINVVMFRSAHRRVRFRVTDGMEVVVRGRVSVYEPRGTLQFYAEELEPRGVGALQLAFTQLKERLAQAGLFDQSRKRPIPFMPRTIGIVTAFGGAGLGDMLTIMLDRFPNLHVIIRPARVQGDAAAGDIAMAIADLNRDGRAQVIIVGRGGGSLEDLWAFNEERVARAIAASSIPIISAVGHEIDYTIADFVADLRAPTPTAAAQMVVPLLDELHDRIDHLSSRLTGAIDDAVATERIRVNQMSARLRHPAVMLRDIRQRLDEAAAGLGEAAARGLADARASVRALGLRLRGPAAMVRESRRAVVRLSGALTAGGISTIDERRRALGSLATRLDSLSPLRVLERGYAVVFAVRDGRAVVDAATVAPGDDLDIRLSRGRIYARATRREI
jgi:exodeoxyribonuclease VII large subunit